MKNQKEFLAMYNNTHRDPFNEELFNRSDEDIIRHVQNVILSSQRNKFFVIKVNHFRVIEDYREIQSILHAIEANRRNKRIKYNRLDYIDLKDSYIKLLEVNYHLEADGKSADINVYISIPRIYNKYYFKIAGSIYSAMYQIVDGSTYNNSNSSNKKADPNVTLKTSFMKITTYIKTHKLVTYDKQIIPCGCFISDIFSSKFPTIKYLLAKFGYYGTLSFLRISDIYVTKEPYTDPNWYSFERGGIYVSVPKYFYENNQVYQSIAYTIISAIPKDGSLNINDIYNVNFWKEVLGAEYKTRTIDKGNSVLDSLEHIYDIDIRNVIRLPEDQKSDIYRILRWIMYEFTALRAKDNTDLSIKRLRFGEYISSLYAAKLSSNIYRISNPNNKVTIEKLISTVSINNNYLLDQLKRCKLITYKNSVNDNDPLMVLKYTYKGIAGIGEKKTSAVPNSYRYVKASHIGRVDKDSSSNSDPGMSGTLCPYVELYEGGTFSDFKEPNTWNRVIDNMMETYRKTNNLREIFVAEEELLGKDNTNNIEQIDASINQMSHIMVPCIEEHSSVPLEDSGTIYLTDGGENNE